MRMILFLLIAAAASSADVMVPRNLDFENALLEPDAGIPGWAVGQNSHEVVLDSTVVHGGRFSLRMHHVEGDGFGVGNQGVDPAPYIGRTALLTGMIRTEGLDEGYAGLWMRIDGAERERLGFDNCQGRGLEGTNDWTELHVALPVPEGAEIIHFGPIMPGKGTAWFDDLRFVAVDPDSVESTSMTLGGSQPRDGRYPPPPDRLWSDAELRSTPSRPDPDPERTARLRDLARPIRALAHEDDMSDLAFLEEALGGRRLVQLGESGHGISEFNMLKVRLIKVLHEHLGYDVLAFESGLLSCHLANAALAERSPAATMQSSIFGVWNTEEVLALFEYLKETHATDRPLILAGFDYQYSGDTGLTDRGRFLESVVSLIDAAYAVTVRADADTLAAAASYGQIMEIDEDVREDHIARLSKLASWLEEHLNELSALDPTTPRLALQVVRSDIRLLDDYRPGIHDFKSRDACMADNIEFLLDERYPDQKIIVWAHNDHIRHLGDDGAPDGFRCMGQVLAERRRDDLYTVGLYMGRGHATMNSRQVYEIEDPPEGSMSAVLEQVGWRALFLDVSAAPVEPATSWLDEMIDVRSWGKWGRPMILRKQYDALIYIDTVQEPLYR